MVSQEDKLGKPQAERMVSQGDKLGKPQAERMVSQEDKLGKPQAERMVSQEEKLGKPQAERMVSQGGEGTRKTTSRENGKIGGNERGCGYAIKIILCLQILLFRKMNKRITDS